MKKKTSLRQVASALAVAALTAVVLLFLWNQDQNIDDLIEQHDKQEQQATIREMRARMEFARDSAREHEKLLRQIERLLERPAVIRREGDRTVIRVERRHARR